MRLEQRQRASQDSEGLRRVHLAPGCERQPIVRLEHIEVVNRVAEWVDVLMHYDIRRLSGEAERRATLASVILRSKTQFGVRLSDRLVVGEDRRVLDA